MTSVVQQKWPVKPAFYFAVHLLFAMGLPHCRSVLTIGLARTIGFLLLSALLLFTIVQAGRLGGTIASWLKALPIFWLAPMLRFLSAGLSLSPFVACTEPTLCPSYQRPPPRFS